MVNDAPESRMRPDRRWLMLVIAAAVIFLDRVTKRWIVAHIVTGGAIVVIPRIFRLTHVLNPGASFNLFEGSVSSGLVRHFLIGFSFLAVGVVLVLLWRLGQRVSATSVGLALVLGGACGNLYDRVRYGYVVDFLEVHVIHYHWPDFNVADSAIVIGVSLLLLEMLWPQRSE